ncbi:molybdopterin-guanine dinucleotide biosynthesis protein B [Metabacillus sp. 84]|uniref:molybdopterin-guanine dinucleotide biosynthesis protein B n=1 Tax=Metabacillus sp. 84 TaxID=3404705 RepID=UPI003CF7DCC1
MGKHCAILQVVGYQNSGKTRLMENLIARASGLGLNVGSLKHHGHGGAPDLHGKDSSRHFEAGAAVSAAEGAGVLQLSARLEGSALEELIQFYSHFNLDVLFIEGYKHARYPKAVLIEKEEDLSLLDQLTGIICVITDLTVPPLPGIEFFTKQQVAQSIDFMIKKAVKQIDREDILPD